MIPVGILTRDRPVLLEATLRSLAGTDLPADVPVTVFDDCSETAEARAHLYGSGTQQLCWEWPSNDRWTAAGLDFLPREWDLRGLADRQRVRKLGDRSVGVVAASSRAVCWLFEETPDCEAAVLLQGDVLLTPDWYERLVRTPGDLVAGFQSEWFPRENAFACGVCYLVRRSCFERSLSWWTRRHCERRDFDGMLCKEVSRLELTIGHTDPDVCQHVGHRSTVRPERPFWALRGWRMSATCPPRYGWSDAVRRFAA